MMMMMVLFDGGQGKGMLRFRRGAEGGVRGDVAGSGGCGVGGRVRGRAWVLVKRDKPEQGGAEQSVLAGEPGGGREEPPPGLL